MADAEVYRLSVRVSGEPVSADLLLPSSMELGEVIPCIVELVGVRTDRVESWKLSRCDGSVLDESVTLRDNGVRDGDLLLLDRARPVSSGTLFYDTTDCVREASPVGDDRWARRMAAVGFGWAAAFGAATLAWPGTSPVTSRTVVAAIVAVGAAVAAVLSERFAAQSWLTLILGTAAAAFGAIGGYLAVPGGPAPPNFFLAAAVCSAMSAVLLHTTTYGDTVFTAIVAMSVTSAAAAAIATIWPAPIATVGAALAAVSVAMLAGAARIAIRLSGLSPRSPSGDDSPAGDGDAYPTVDMAQAEHGHRMLTGLLAGFAIAAALGSVLVAADAHENTLRAAAFTAAIAAALIARASHQQGSSRSAAVLFAGMVSATAMFALCAASMPHHRAVVCLGSVVVGSTAMIVAHSAILSQMSPFARRRVEVTEYLLLASIVPLGCWVSGAFELARGLSLQ